MLFNYPCRFVLIAKNMHISESVLHAKGFKQHKNLNSYILYIDHGKDSRFIERDDDRTYFMLEGRFWNDIQEDNHLLTAMQNANEDECVRLLKEINGFYSGIYYDARKEACYLFSDKFGFHNIYRTIDNMVFSNSLFTLVDLIGYKPDTISLFEHIILEYPIENRTYFENIKVIPSLNVSKCINSRYTEILYDIKTENKTTVIMLEQAFDDLFSKLASWNVENFGISLSIGKDSRVILYFLNKYQIHYDVLTFQYEPTHMEYKTVQKITSFLGKKATLVPFENISNDEIIAFSELPTFSNEFYRLGCFAKQNGIDYLALGYLGDHISGKLEYFRNIGIDNLSKLGDAYFKNCLHGIQKMSIENLSNFFKEGYQVVKDNCRNSFGKYRKYEYDLPKVEILHYLENRGSRRILSVMKYVAQNSNIILPFTESNIFRSYINLPNHLISSQQAHTRIAAKDPSAAAAHSIGLPIPIPLKYEPYIRKPVQYLNKIKNLFPEKEPICVNTEVNLKSRAICDFLGKETVLTTPKLAHRLHCLDEYFQFVETHFTQSGLLFQP